MCSMKGKLHAWRIEDREYARQEEWRGRRHVFETLKPARTALVVIDMDMVPFFVPGSSYCLGIVPNISGIAAALRAVGGTVAWVVPATADRMVVSEEFCAGCDAKLRVQVEQKAPAVALTV